MYSLAAQRLLLTALLFAVTATAFVSPNVFAPSSAGAATTPAFQRMAVKELFSDAVGLEELESFDDEDDDDNDDGDTMQTDTSTRLKSARWDSLNPKIKERIIKKGQERAIANKKKREPAQDKRRRMMMYMKQKKKERKDDGRVQRPLSFQDRTPLAALIPGMETSGIVISLTAYGAYVDVGTECDGLLHVSQLSNTFFVEHPRQMLTPGDEVMVRVRSTFPERKKLHLTMLPLEVLEAEQEDDVDDRIPLLEIQSDDELWGELKRVTDYGAYVEVGAEVSGFLHFMDHPAFGWSQGSHPSEFMTVGDRVRVWVMDVDNEQRRVKLTANRPTHLPGPRREL